jgi:hypothetical protein
VRISPGAGAGTAEVALHHFSSPNARWSDVEHNWHSKPQKDRNMLCHFFLKLGVAYMLLSLNYFLQS